MILKVADDKSEQIQQLEALSAVAPADVKSRIEQELRNVRAGIKAEQESAYLINFDMKQSKNTAVIHDLRLEINGRVAQIDHVLIHRSLNIFVLETKHLHAGLKISEQGDFTSWNNFKKCYEGMPSPLAQNDRHIAVLKEAMERIDLPSKLGLRLSPIYHSYVLISPKSRIDRPKSFDTSQVIKTEMLHKTINRLFEEETVFDTLGRMARWVSMETLEKAGRTLLRMHRPASFDYAARFGMQASSVRPAGPEAEGPSAVTAAEAAMEAPTCKECNGVALSIQYGKYGYYFKCRSCNANSPIRISCGKDGHKERIRKEGPTFYRECPDCGYSRMFFKNPE